MSHHTENCFICGKPLVYFESAKPIRCSVCRTLHHTNAACEAGHYVCDRCHADRGFLLITQTALETQSKNPILIATAMMKSPNIHMHGPEHHYLVAASLLAAYQNAGATVDLGQALQNAGQRAAQVPGGVCGLWGSCGAGIATGIFISIITGATPLSEKEWALSNRMTSESLHVISENGGPRCCKRNSYLAISQAAAFAAEHLGVVMELPRQIVCGFSHRNQQCTRPKCPYSGLRQQAGECSGHQPCTHNREPILQ